MNSKPSALSSVAPSRSPKPKKNKRRKPEYGNDTKFQQEHRQKIEHLKTFLVGQRIILLEGIAGWGIGK